MNLLKTTLDNGLRLLLQERHTAPVISFWVWYRVGSRNEHLGITGVSHWVEHMMFKGSEQWPTGAMDRAIARVGGHFNAMTWYDFTAYYTTIPAAKVMLPLEIESDRMQHALFREADVEAERTVIISERQGAENSPDFLLGEAVGATAFHVHPYGHETIGHLCDIQTMTRDDLYGHYRRYYLPNNAILAVAGDFNVGEMLRIIERYFAAIPAGEEPPPVHAVEPEQRGERRIVVEGEGGTDLLSIVYHVPPATHDDLYPLIVLAAVLAGGSASLVGGGLTNHTSRLYRKLVESELAVDVSAQIIPMIDPGLFRLHATLHNGHHPDEIEPLILEEIETIAREGIEPQELEKAKRQARALFAYASESITNQAFWLGFSEIFADYGWYLGYLRRLEAVQAEEVQAVAQRYFGRRNRTVGWYLAGGER